GGRGAGGAGGGAGATQRGGGHGKRVGLLDQCPGPGGRCRWWRGGAGRRALLGGVGGFGPPPRLGRDGARGAHPAGAPRARRRVDRRSPYRPGPGPGSGPAAAPGQGVRRTVLARRRRWALGRRVLGAHRPVVLVRPANTTLVLPGRARLGLAMK